jgi:hypothetical protein
LRWTAALLGLVLTSPAAAADPAWHGVWSGTIGTLPVQVCLQAPFEGSDYSHGSYFYLSRKQPIPLSREADGSWSETDAGKETGRWTVVPQGRDRLTGQWRSGKRNLPVALKRVAFDDAAGDGPCGSRAYVAPRVSPIKIVRKPETSGGFAYTKLTYDVGPSFSDVTIESFAFPETRPGDRAINAALLYDPAKPEGDADYVGCAASAAGSLGGDGEFIATRGLELITREFLVVQENSGGFCGGAHPDYGYQWRVWDRQSGKPVALAAWLNDKAIAERPEPAGEGGADSSAQITPALRRIALRHIGKIETECRETLDQADYWSFGLAAGGLVMTPSLPHVAAACGADAVVPFAEVAPFLTPSGKAQVARFNKSR